MTGTSSTQPLTDRIRQERAAAAAVMTSLGGTSSACAMGRNGQSFPAYKYHEGRAAALGRLGRGLRPSGTDPRGVVAAEVESWRREVTRRAGTGRNWEAYAAGGLDAAQSVAGWLDAQKAIGPPVVTPTVVAQRSRSSVAWSRSPA